MHDLAAAIGWAEIITQILIYVATAVAIPLALKYIAKWTNLKIDDKTRAYVEAAASAAIRHGVSAYAASKQLPVTEAIREAINNHEVRQKVIGSATDYLSTNVPDGLSRLGLNTADQVQTLATTRIDKALNSLSSDVQGIADSVADIEQTGRSGMSSGARAAM